MSTAFNPILEVEFQLSSYHTDAFGFMKMNALFELFQDAAGKDAGRKGFGYHDLLPENKAWVLLRILIDVQRMPRWDDTVLLRTWPKESSGAMAFRDFELLDDQRKTLISGTSTWSQINLETRRPVRIDATANYQAVPDLHSMEEKAGKVKVPEGMRPKKEITVQYSQIDIMWHVNNTRYLEWVLNELPIEFLKDNQLKRLEANFIAEAKLGDVLVIDTVFDGEKEAYGTVSVKDRARPSYAVHLNFIDRS